MIWWDNMVELSGESETSVLEKKYDLFESDIVSALRLLGEHTLIKVFKRRDEKSSMDFLMLNADGRWNGFRMGINDVLETFALAIDDNFRENYLELDDEQTTRYIMDSVNRERLLISLVNCMQETSDILLWDRLMSNSFE